MRKRLLIWSVIGGLLICFGCGKKAAPTPRNQVMEKEASQKGTTKDTQKNLNAEATN